MVSLLETVDKHIKEKGIEFKGITIDRKVMPHYINQAVLHYIRKSSGVYFYKGNFTYVLDYDDSGSLYLLAFDAVYNTKIVIAREKHLDLPFMFFKYAEDKLIRDACFFKYFGRYIKGVKECEKLVNPHKSSRQIREFEYYLNEEVINRGPIEMIANPEFNINKIRYMDKIIKSAMLINDYIDYLYLFKGDFETYKKSLKKD